MLVRASQACLVALGVLVLPVHLSAQEAAPAAPAAAEQTAADPKAEAAQIQARLQEIQQRVLQDPEVQAAQAKIGEDLTAVMTRIDAEFTARTERAEALKAEVAAAQEAKDNAKLNELAAEAEKIQGDFAATRQRALQDPEMVGKVQALQQQIVAKMVEVEPETRELIARLQELSGNGS